MRKAGDLNHKQYGTTVNNTIVWYPVRIPVSVYLQVGDSNKTSQSCIVNDNYLTLINPITLKYRLLS